MTDEELTATWTTLAPDDLRRQRMDARVGSWLEARDTSLAAEWAGLFRRGPFAALGLVTAGALSTAVATPLVWILAALIR